MKTATWTPSLGYRKCPSNLSGARPVVEGALFTDLVRCGEAVGVAGGPAAHDTHELILAGAQPLLRRKVLLLAAGPWACWFLPPPFSWDAPERVLACLRSSASRNLRLTSS